jgi:hypothetical protein
MIKRRPKKVWYDGVLWKVVDILSPHKDEDFFLLSRVHPDTVHDDGRPCHEMTCVDIGNCQIYPDNLKVREIMRQINRGRQEFERVQSQYREQLTHEWLELCGIH